MEPDFSPNAVTVLQRRYLRRNQLGELVETPAQLLRRVARAAARAERAHGVADASTVEDRYYRLMASRRFLPNSPTLMNAGLPRGQLAACFVLPLDDSLRSIFRALSDMALVHQSGGGTGFSFSRLRPRGDVVRSTGGVASGPVSFLRIFDVATEVIKQGGRRRGANMGVLAASHPDVEEFVRAKRTQGVFENFNLSVAAPEAFMDAVAGDREWPLVNPRTGKQVAEVPARSIWAELADSAWRSGEPGVIFIDRVNAANPTPFLGRFDATNPCGEQPLLPHESCNLGSLRLSAYTSGGDVDWGLLAADVALAVQFLDDVIDVNSFPLRAIAEATRLTRKVGLGVMGFADALADLGVPYASREALDWAERFMSRIAQEAAAASRALAARRGVFPAHKLGNVRSGRGQRNATLTTIAPTGTISILADCTSGIEPPFAIAYRRRTLGGEELLEVNRRFEAHARRNGYYSPGLMEEAARTGSVAHVQGVPSAARLLFQSAHDIEPEWHVRVQAAFQRHVDNAVSKTVNLPNSAAVDAVSQVLDLAYRLGCKGITVYRDGSRDEQVLQRGAPTALQQQEPLTVGEEFAGGCPVAKCTY